MNLQESKIFNTKIKHGFFSRNGGVSSGLYESLNCSVYVDDDLSCVQTNLRRISNYFEADHLCVLKQVHGDKVILIDENFDFSKSEQKIEADGLVTKLHGVCLGILTADCAPVLLHDVANDTIGAVHCGWKSARSGVIENVIKTMHDLGKNRPEIVAAIGPCIHKDSYIVKKDFLCNFEEEFLGFFEKFGEDYKFDLPGYVQAKLIKYGIISTDILDIDTYRSEDFFSYRKANQKTNGICGRQLSTIMLI